MVCRRFMLSIIFIFFIIIVYYVIMGESNTCISDLNATIPEDNCGEYEKSINFYTLQLNETTSYEQQAKILIDMSETHSLYGHFNKAIESLNLASNLTKSDNTMTEIQRLLVNAYYLEGLFNFSYRNDYEEAIECYNIALNITLLDNSIRSKIIHQKGLDLYELNRYEEALNCYEKALELEQDSSNRAKILNEKGLAYYELKQYYNATNSYNKSLEFDADNKTRMTSLNNRGFSMNWSGRYNEAIESYDKALDLVDQNEFTSKNNAIIILNNKGNALKQLNRTAEAAMVYSKANELDMGPQKKSGIFIAFLLLYSVLASAGYVLYRRCKPPITAVMLSANLLGFLAVIWIFSSLFDPALIWQLLLVAPVMAIIAGTLWSFLGLPKDPWKTQIILTFRDFERERVFTTGMIKATGLVAAIGYLILASFFYFRINMDSEKFMADFLGFALLVITLTGLFVALPPIVGALLSENLDRDSRDILQIILFSYLGIVFFYLLLILWSFQIGGLCLHNIGDVGTSGGISLNISPAFLGTAMSLLLFAFLLPYISGWMRAKRHAEMLLQREISWIDRLLNVLEFPTPSLYVQKLGKVLSDIGEDKTVSDLDDDEISLTTLREHGLHLVDPRLRYEVFLGDLQDRIKENIQQFEELKDDEETLMKRAQIYAEAYRIRKDEIIGSVDKESNIKPKLLIVLIFVLAPILTQILSMLSIKLTESLSKLVSGGILP